jgi:hypothetical protein
MIIEIKIIIKYYENLVKITIKDILVLIVIEVVVPIIKIINKVNKNIINH